jgi:hypothetical protein
MDYARRMLDELMGPGRNNDFKDTRHFTDVNVCTDYLVGYCPTQLFTNTKSDLGTCTKIHDDKLKLQYHQDANKDKYGYEENFHSHLLSLIRDLDRKVRKAKERLELKNDDSSAVELQNAKDELIEQTILMEERIRAFQDQIEKCGDQGMIDEAQDCYAQMESLYGQLQVLKTTELSTRDDKRMEVCQVCAALLVINDAPERMIAHVEGKQHTGYLKLRETLAELENARQERLRQQDLNVQLDKKDNHFDSYRRDGNSMRREQTSFTRNRQRNSPPRR